MAGPSISNASLEVRQQIFIYDYLGYAGDSINLPKLKKMTPWLYIMNGAAIVDKHRLDKGDAITGGEDEITNVILEKDSTLVLFLVDLNAEMSFTGNFSGIK
ncbi:hypothetical protein ABE125_12195 [Bacillus subtilis]